MHVGEIKSRRGAPVPEQPGLDVLGPEPFAQQRVLIQVNLAHGEVVGGPPVGVHPTKFVGGQRRARSRQESGAQSVRRRHGGQDPPARCKSNGSVREHFEANASEIRSTTASRRPRVLDDVPHRLLRDAKQGDRGDGMDRVVGYGALGQDEVVPGPVAAPGASGCGRPSRGGRSTGATRTRTSTIVAPCSWTITGLQSSSATCGRSSTNAATRSSTLMSAVTSAGGRPRTPASAGAILRPWTISRASRSVRGVRRTATSRNTSTRVPPAPQASTGPKRGSCTTP